MLPAAGVILPIGCLDGSERCQHDGQARALKVGSQRVCESLHRRPRRRVGHGAGPGEPRRHRGDVDDLTGTPLQHARQQFPRQVERAQIRQGHHGGGLFRRCLEQRQPAAGAGVVDQDVGAAVLRQDAGGGRSESLCIAKVDRIGVRHAVPATDIGSDFAQPVSVPGEEDHAAAFRGKQPRCRFTDPARCARDDGYRS